MIVVTAPTSNIGRQVVVNLLQGDEPVRLIARDPGRLPVTIRERAEVVQGSHAEAEVVGRAFADANAVFWLVPPNSEAASLEAAYLGFTRAAAEVFRRGRVRRVVGVSALGRGAAAAGKAGLVTASLAMDDLIAGTGVAYRALAMPSFMDNLLRQVEALRTESAFSGPIPAGHRAPTCATCDVAAAASRLLLDPGWSGVGHVPVLGPEDLSPSDMAGIMSEVLGRPITYRHVLLEAFRANLLARGMSEAFAQGYADMMQAKADGLDNAEPRTAEATTPTTFRSWCESVLRPTVLA